MIKSIKVNLNILEYMLYFWQASSENEKVNEEYLAEITAQPEMATLYTEDFTAADLRKVLSALTNREKLSDISEVAYNFMRNNMWVMDDMGLLSFMVAPIKVLNVDELVEKVNAAKDIPYENVEVIFLPGTTADYFIQENKLYINFFKVQADIYDETNVTIDGVAVREYIEAKLLELA